MNHTISNFEDLGKEFQIQLLNEVVTDHKFGKSIVDIIKPDFFSADAFKKIVHIIKKYHDKHEVLPNFESLKIQIDSDVPVEHEALRAQLKDTLSQVQLCKIGNLNVQENSIKFCRLQAIRGAINEVKTRLDRGIISDYDEIEKRIKDAITFKEQEDPIMVFDNMEKVLSEDYRDPIPTNISGIDDITKGGLSKGELAMVIAPLGVGKTTFLTKVANSAFTEGRNVLQVFFEDKEEAIQRKHFSCLTGIPLSELHLNKETIRTQVNAIKGKHNNHLFLQKLPSDGTTVSKIKNVIKKINSKGDKVDVLVLDYIDCLSMDKGNSGSEEWSNEGKVMRSFETMVEEMNVAAWTATQGNRSATSIEVVKTENMGGNLKKAQIAHFIMSIGKTLEQKEQKVATISILKNRMGDDGMIFKDCKFDNSRIIIDTEDLLTENGFESQKKAKKLEGLRKYLNKEIAEVGSDPEKEIKEISENV